MNIKLLKNTLFAAGISLLLFGCGDNAGQKAPTDGSTPAKVSNTLKVKRLSKTYVITGIGLSGANKVAIINNEQVTPGMEIDPGVVLKDVKLTYAVIQYGNTEYLLRPESIQDELDKKKK